MQDLFAAPGHRGIECGFFFVSVFCFGALAPALQSFRQTWRNFFLVHIFVAAESWEHQRHHAFQNFWIAPKNMEGLIKQITLVASIDVHGVQGPVKIIPVADANRFNRFDGAQHVAGSDGQPGGAQRSSKMHYIGR